VGADVPATSPGQQRVHYSPRTPTFRFETSQRGLIQPETDGLPNGMVILSPLKIFKKYGTIIAMPNDPAQYARHVYAVLRELDDMPIDAIYVEIPPDVPEWTAIRDRLLRASRPLAESPLLA
jgi:L-threonylcarbamoyladenylate synthase